MLQSLPPPSFLHHHTTIKNVKSLVNSCYRLAEYRFWIECFQTNPLKSTPAFNPIGGNGGGGEKQTILQLCFCFFSALKASFQRRATSGMPAERLQRAPRQKRRADSPEEDRLSLPDRDIVHHSAVRLRISLAADGQPCRHKKQNPQTEQQGAFGRGDKVSA